MNARDRKISDERTMRRREFLGGSAAVFGAAAAPALAQPAARLTVGWLTESAHPFLAVFRRALEERGYREPGDPRHSRALFRRRGRAVSRR